MQVHMLIFHSMTAIYIAAQNGHDSVVEQLVFRGANVELKHKGLLLYEAMDIQIYLTNVWTLLFL